MSSELEGQGQAAAQPEGSAGERPSLAARIPAGGTRDSDEILDRFLGWVADTGLTPYPEQEEALLELMIGRHVVLSTPTGSGKSLVALGLHFKAMCEGERSVYTAPIKALASEKFFALCEDFGPENVGMLTGDASINRDAPILCCTTEVLSNMALREGQELEIAYVVLDEFHYYADRARGVAWQVPLLALPHACFLLMSATLGNTAPIEERLRARSGRDVSHIHSDERPVPLDFEYSESPLHTTVNDLVESGKAPVYVVNFTQRECGEQAQGLTSVKLCTREEKREIGEMIAMTRFDSAYGKEIHRFLRAGIGVHHAGLLPRYRLLVEQLAGRGLLKVICGTDTLGVGVNIPIRTVLFTALSKFNGEKVAMLSVREFKQIAGRAGRKGFDEQGSVVCQAPEHIIEKKRLSAKADTSGKKKKAAKVKAPRGFVAWNKDTFQRLIERPPEALESRFEVTHGMLINLLQRPGAEHMPGGGYRALADLIAQCHEGAGRKARLQRHAAVVFRSLVRAGIVEVVRDPAARQSVVRLSADLQEQFSLHDTLSLYLVEALEALDPESEDYAFEVLSLVEAILENPRVILYAQVNRAKSELIARLKAEGVPYEERMRELEDVTYPKPSAEFIYATFKTFSEHHPWVENEDIRPKSIAREMFEEYRSFVDYAKEYGLARSEGVLLRYLSQVHNTLVKSVPETAKNDAVYDAIVFLHATLQRVDSSLMEAWEELLEPGSAPARADPVPLPPFDLARHPKLLAARARSEMHELVYALAAEDYAQAMVLMKPGFDEHGEPWNEDTLRAALLPFREEYGAIVFTARERQSRFTTLKSTGPRSWDVFQVLADAAGDNLWAIEGEIELAQERDPEGPLFSVRRIGP